MGRRKYNTEEERKVAMKAYMSAYMTDYRATHKDEKAACDAAYRATHKEEIAAKKAAYNATPFGRATNLVRAYRRADSKYNRGECTITPQWVVENVFSGQCCVYCGESDWHLLGCDRKDNALPHTPENCVPCCASCNCKKHTKSYNEFIGV